jgi:hypothetical protein
LSIPPEAAYRHVSETPFHDTAQKILRYTPKKEKASGTEVPWRLNFQNLQAACFHGQLRKVRVALKVDRKTNCVGNQEENRRFRTRCLAPLFTSYDDRLGSQADNGKNQSQLSVTHGGTGGMKILAISTFGAIICPAPAL